MKNVLITGGAGFIGSFVSEALNAKGRDVTILDCLDPQVHGKAKPSITRSTRFIRGEVGNRSLLRKLLPRVDAIVHLAAAVGVGQSMYQIEKYVRLNTHQTSVLLEELARQSRKLK